MSFQNEHTEIYTAPVFLSKTLEFLQVIHLEYYFVYCISLVHNNIAPVLYIGTIQKMYENP